MSIQYSFQFIYKKIFYRFFLQIPSPHNVLLGWSVYSLCPCLFIDIWFFSSIRDAGNTFRYRLWKHFPLQTMETHFSHRLWKQLSAVYYGNTFRYRLGKHFQLQTRETLFAIYCRLWIHFPSGEEEKRQKRLHWLNKS